MQTKIFTALFPLIPAIAGAQSKTITPEDIVNRIKKQISCNRNGWLYDFLTEIPMHFAENQSNFKTF